jgi:hypothetical protein
LRIQRKPQQETPASPISGFNASELCLFPVMRAALDYFQPVSFDAVYNAIKIVYSAAPVSA